MPVTPRDRYAKWKASTPAPLLRSGSSLKSVSSAARLQLMSLRRSQSRLLEEASRRDLPRSEGGNQSDGEGEGGSPAHPARHRDRPHSAGTPQTRQRLPSLLTAQARSGYMEAPSLQDCDSDGSPHSVLDASPTFKRVVRQEEAKTPPSREESRQKARAALLLDEESELASFERRRKNIERKRLELLAPLPRLGVLSPIFKRASSGVSPATADPNARKSPRSARAPQLQTPRLLWRRSSSRLRLGFSSPCKPRTLAHDRRHLEEGDMQASAFVSRLQSRLIKAGSGLSLRACPAAQDSRSAAPSMAMGLLPKRRAQLKPRPKQDGWQSPQMRAKPSLRMQHGLPHSFGRPLFGGA